MTIDQLKEILEDSLSDIDATLKKRNSPMGQRPLHAALIFVEAFVIEVKGEGTVDDYMDTDWFARIYSLVEEWYHKRYGETVQEEGLRGNTKSTVKGIVPVFNHYYEVKIPLTLTEIEEEGEQIWLEYPKNIKAKENPFDWLPSELNLEELSDEQLDSLKGRLKFLGEKIRNIELNLMSSVIPDQRKDLVNQILVHLEEGVEFLVSARTEKIALALWKFHLSVEKILKVFLIQKRGDFKTIHDLETLKDDTSEFVDANKITSEFDNFPHYKEGIGQRYGEGKNFSIDEAIEIYDSALRIICWYSDKLDKRLDLKGSRFLIEAAPWVKGE